jgi:hypothetical protein
MKSSLRLLVCVFCGALPAIAPALSGQAPDAAQVLAAAREALGGEKKLSAVKGFVITGRTRQVRGNNLVPIEFEISCELPDKFVRKDDFPAQELEPTTQGFNGETLIQFPPPPAPGAGRGGPPGAGPGGPPPGARESAVRSRVRRFGRGGDRGGLLLPVASRRGVEHEPQGRRFRSRASLGLARPSASAPDPQRPDERRVPDHALTRAAAGSRADGRGDGASLDPRGGPA